MLPGRSLADEVERRGTTVSEDADALVLTARRVLCMAAISEAVIDRGCHGQIETDGHRHSGQHSASSGNLLALSPLKRTNEASRDAAEHTRA